ncbi:MAG: nicotinate-nucleotide--dimethylbenzimidazole phosphoribosyltransferase [Anaerolineales bacterium]|nr:nicotinate-nucleotide--dimethylbenzimidazole phosphoribosyltransferase [Anaerolineales bacterium]MDW8162967.1 nicotinate-nucleotide--dimethylbenzimidazole phosphoribosyltransferase [Anaerolineales bacterium]
MELDEIIRQIQPLDERAMGQAQMRQNRLTKPPGSLGRLESLSIQVAGITGQIPPRVDPKVIFVMAGDHGVTEEGVSAYPSEVTAQMVLNFLHGGAAINVLARHVGAKVVVVDLGVKGPLEPRPDLVSAKIAPGTQNIARGPAMSRDQALQAVLKGYELALAEIRAGAQMLATGDMGIGNTTPAAAIAAALTGRAPSLCVGRGTGVDDSGLLRKISAVERALVVNRPNPQDGLDVLAKVGGFEIGGLVGAILAGAAHRRPVVVDGFISTAAAMIAVRLSPLVRPYLIAAHRSKEQGHSLMLEWLGLEPVFDLEMRLGEGTGAALAMSVVEASCKILAEMATFEEAGVSEKL